MSGLRIGIDIGGTFTDFAAVGGDGELTVVKEPSTHASPATALGAGLERLAGALGLDGPRPLLDRTELVVQGTTVALNAVLERAGVPTGLLATEGFRDSLEIRLGHKDRRYDFRAAPPEPIVPRSLRRPVPERVDRHGRIVRALDEEAVRRHVRDLRDRGVQSIAVVLLWSFLHPAHERRIREIVLEEHPDAFVSLSSDVWPHIREYDRTSTTVLNAYIGPLVAGYVEAVEALLRSHGFSGAVRYVHSSGGLATGEALRRRPIIALNSGPAAGPAAAEQLGRRLRRRDLLLMDMGGTSFDVTLVHQGAATTVKSSDFHGHRVGIPMIDLHTIGAGGGSIASVDATGLLRVGPRSAGAWPGPACYGRGGTAATVTDASVVLGYLGEIRASQGDIAIDRDAAARAIDTHVARPLGLSVDEAAAGVHQVANEQMAAAIGVVSVERGHDPRTLAGVVGGGAGALHATALAERLGVPVLSVPRFAGALCAFGAAVAPVRIDRGFSVLRRWDEVDAAELRERLGPVERAAVSELVAAGVAAEHARVERRFGVRYVGQVHELATPAPAGPLDDAALDAVARSFHARHQAQYGYADSGAPIELIDIDITVAGGGRQALREGEDPVAASEPSAMTRTAWFDGMRDVPVHRGPALGSGFRAEGPCLIEEDTTTIVVRPGWTVTLDADVYVLERAG